MTSRNNYNEDKSSNQNREIVECKLSERGRGTLKKSSPAILEHYLKGIHFPVDRKGLLQRANENGAPPGVIHALKQFDEHEYKSPIDVSKELGRI